MYASTSAFLSLIILLTPTALNFSFPLVIQKPMTILDYYLLMPQQFLRLPMPDSRAARESAISIRDIENGYLQIRQQAAETYTALALFNEPNGKDLVAVEARSCSRGCLSKLTFLRYEKEQWVDVTSETLPVIDDARIRGILTKQLSSKDGNPIDFQPLLLHTLPRDGSVIDLSEHWSGMAIGRLEWTGGKFVFKSAVSPDDINGQNVLASEGNTNGDRLQIIGINPRPPAKLPLKGHLRVSVAYELKSARACLIWVIPVITERRLPDHFSSASSLHKQGSGVVTKYFGFNNQAHVDKLKVVMADEQHKELLTLIYNVDADWEGVLECPSLRVSCFSNAPNSAVPIGCTVYPSGLRPDQYLTYYWTISGGNIISGHGTHHIKIDTGGEESVTATVDVGGLDEGCVANASFTSTAATISRPSK